MIQTNRSQKHYLKAEAIKNLMLNNKKCFGFCAILDTACQAKLASFILSLVNMDIVGLNSSIDLSHCTVV